MATPRRPSRSGRKPEVAARSAGWVGGGLSWGGADAGAPGGAAADRSGSAESAGGALSAEYAATRADEPNFLPDGHLPIIINALGDMIDGHRAGKYKIIATGGVKRSALLPDVPTLKEVGVEMVAQGGVWVYGPPGMRADTVRALNAALVKAVNMPDFRERFAKSGVTVAPSTPQELAKIQAEELKQWAEPVRASGFKENG